MALRVYNTLNGRKEDFKPLNEGAVKMYVCGITPYDYSHIGHARAYIAFDVIYRYLQYKGFKVTYCRNYTNIDDNIIKRANEIKEEPATLAERFINAYKDDMSSLNVESPDIEPRVTEEIDSIIKMITRIIENGHGYVIDGDVYFDIGSYHGYGKLSGRQMKDMLAGARVEIDERKKNPLDFALWKSAKPGEPSWDSPWGKGRPGWHIECSAMSQKYLGTTFDIHGGGKDLVFPHHENEIAQSEAANKQPFVKYWLHNGFVNVDSEKMSKSLGNFFTIKEVIQKFHPEVLRYFILTTHYRSPINFSDKNLEDAGKRVDYHFETLKRASDFLAQNSPEPAEISQLDVLLKEIDEKFTEAMDDDFNAPLALAGVQDLFSAVNEMVEGKGIAEKLPNPARAYAVKKLTEAIKNYSNVFGMWQWDVGSYLEKRKEAEKVKLGAKGVDTKEIEKLINARFEARKNKDFAKADALRKQLAEMGVELKDTATGTEWKLKE